MNWAGVDLKEEKNLNELIDRLTEIDEEIMSIWTNKTVTITSSIYGFLHLADQAVSNARYEAKKYKILKSKDFE